MIETSVTQTIKAFALAVGFDRVGVASVEPFDVERLFLEERQRAGYGPHAFEVADIEKRCNPQQYLPGARSAIVVLLSYNLPEPKMPKGLRGWLSRYCRGIDYHDYMIERLQSVADRLLEAIPGAQYRVHVDMDAPLDRALAVRAGLGRFGKNTMLIAPKLGTYTFIGELFTTVDLTPDAPLEISVCGSCTRCLDACPTQCLSEWRIDADRCLGSINQMDGDMLEPYREINGIRLFGCDDCQTSCPYNSKASETPNPALFPLPYPGSYPDLLEILGLDDARFTATWGKTAAAWRGLEVIQRNALVALGNLGKPEAISPLAGFLTHSSPVLRSHAAWALQKISELNPTLIPQIEKLLC